MSSRKNIRRVFHPTMESARLEERVVLSGTKAAVAAAVTTPVAAPSPFTPLTTTPLTQAQVRTNFMNAFQSDISSVQRTINAQINSLFANGRPSTQALTDFSNNLAGAIDASTFRLSSQFGLLPGNTNATLNALQNRLVGPGPASLVNQVQQLSSQTNATANSIALRTAVMDQLRQLSRVGTSSLNNFFNNNNLTQLSVNQLGQQIPIQQFIGNQIMSQTANTLGSLAQTFTNQANPLFFNSNGTPPTAQQLTNFQTQASQGLNTAAFQLNGDLAVFGNAANQLAPQLQNTLFGSNPGQSGLLSTLIGVPTSPTTFTTNTMAAFNQALQGTATTLNNFFSTPSLTPPTLPNGNIPPTFNPVTTKSNPNFAFNGGFNSGFPGFGTAPTTFNNNFATGFNSFVTSTNTNFGFNGTPTSGFPGFGTTTTTTTPPVA